LSPEQAVHPAPTDSHRHPALLALALGLSLLLHAALLARLDLSLTAAVPVEPALSPVAITLRRPAAAPPVPQRERGATPVPADPTAVPPSAAAVAEPPAAAPPESGLVSEPEPARPALRRDGSALRPPARSAAGLDLSLPALPREPPRTARGTVVDPRLSERLARAREQRVGRPAAASDAPDPAAGADFSSGRWTSRLRVGDLCFDVVEANPLEPLSREQWFAVACD
jgi:hypothetical protein